MKFKDWTIAALVLWAVVKFFNPTINEYVSRLLMGRRKEETKTAPARLRRYVTQLREFGLGISCLSGILERSDVDTALMNSKIEFESETFREARYYLIENQDRFPSGIEELIGRLPKGITDRTDPEFEEVCKEAPRAD